MNLRTRKKIPKLNKLISNKKIGWYCRFTATVTALAFLYCFSERFGDFASYFRLMSLVLLSLPCIFVKEDKRAFSWSFAHFSVTLFLLLSLFLSFLFKSHSQEGITLENALLLVFAFPLAEELFFRRTLLTGNGTFLAAVCSSLAFSAFHGVNPIPIFLQGLILSYLYSLSGSILIPLLAHILNNAVALWISFFDIRIPLILALILSLPIHIRIKNNGQ